MGTKLLGESSLFLFLLLVLSPGGDSAATTAEPQYLVLVPFLISTETPEKICIQLNHLNETVTLSTTLEYGTENKSLINNIVSKKDEFQCVEFQLSKWTGAPQVYLTVEVKGETLRFRSRKTVLVRNRESLVFVQTDKPIYKPGQLVQFRVVFLTEDLRPLPFEIPLVYIEDPKRNRLMQWTNVELETGLVQLSFPLTSEPAEGIYKVLVEKAPGKTVQHSFEVKEYVLPKFEVVVKAPKTITILAEEVEVSACATYTYGKPVPGLVKISVCRKYVDTGYGYYGSSQPCYGEESVSLCEEFSAEADVHGCFSQVVKTKIFHMKRTGYAMHLDVVGKVTEEGTEVELTGTSSIGITATISKVTFERVDPYYKPGIPYFGEVKLVDGSDMPMANKTIMIHTDPSGHKANYTTDSEGRAQFSIDTTNFTDASFRIHANYKLEAVCHDRNWIAPVNMGATQSPSRFYSPSQSYVHIEPDHRTLSCGQTQPIQVHYVLKQDGLKEEEITFHYVVKTKGRILQSGNHVLHVDQREVKGVFPLELSVTMDTAPLVRLLVYVILPSGELVAHSSDFAVENCLANKVKLWFPEPEGLPGSQTQLHLAATKNSLCGIQAVDKSVFLLKPEAELSPQTVYDLLPVKKLQGYYYDGHSLDESDLRPCEKKEIIVDGIRYSPVPFSFGEADAYEVLKDFGLKVFTSTKIHKPNLCQEHWSSGRPEVSYMAAPMARYSSVPMRGMELHSDTASVAMETVRRFFPETWIWKLVIAKDSYTGGDDFFDHSKKQAGVVPGEATLSVTIPDTITDWQTAAFCMSPDTGFGLAQSVSLRAFQPFFIEPTLPYSVVRGEVFPLKATAFTYQDNCMRVSISLAPSPDFEAVLAEKEETSDCLCANGRKTVTWMVTPKTLGQVNFTASVEVLDSDQPCGNEIVETVRKGQKDTVIKSLLVEPEGIPKDEVYSHLLCGAEKSQSLAPASLKLPENVVEGSARASSCALGDILSSAIQNLHQLVQMPYGCGEQNMALFAPIIYIVDYLNNTNQLTEEMKSKSIGYLVTGFQRQLNYKHSDGSYSAFGPRGQEPGNTWLTAFVLKSFAQARSKIYIENKHIQDALNSLAIRQKENGCFQSYGSLLSNALKGGVDDEVTLSAYITIVLLEIPLPLSHSVLRNALFCLETAAQAKEIHVYTQALLAYAFTLAGKEDKRQEMLHMLDREAVKAADGSLHWRRPGIQEEEADFPFRRHRASSAEVEMTAYVLLAYLSKQPAPAAEEVDKATRIVQWLSRQQNPTGGFSSTQDTVVALQGLSLFGAITFSKSGKGTEVTLSSGEKVLRKFPVDSTNRLLLQCEPLPKVPGDYQMEATGDSCVYVQTILKYNVHPRKEDAPFDLEVHTDPESCTGPKAHQTFNIVINASYVGPRPSSNMAIIDVKMVSGFIPVKSSVRKLKTGQVQRTDVTTSHVLLYLEKVTNETLSFSFAVEMEVPVQSLKPALVTIYDYYQPDDRADAFYSAPCSKDKAKQTSA